MSGIRVALMEEQDMIRSAKLREWILQPID
jgi:hypothetical protein